MSETETNLDVALSTITHIAKPIVEYGAKRIANEIAHGFQKYNKNNIPRYASIYQTMSLKFKNDYSLDTLTENLCTVINKYYTSQQDEEIKYRQIQFKFIYDFMHAEESFCSLGFKNNPMDIDDSEMLKEENTEFAIPMVSGIVFYLFPISETRHELSVGLEFLNQIKVSLLNIYNLRNHNMFLYIDTRNEEDANQIYNELQKKSDNKLKRIVNKKKTLKILNNELVTKTVSEWM